MNKGNHSPWWTMISWRGKAAADRQPDFADMGTAFGLDASLASDFVAPGGDSPLEGPTSQAGPGKSAKR